MSKIKTGDEVQRHCRRCNLRGIRHPSCNRTPTTFTVISVCTDGMLGPRAYWAPEGAAYCPLKQLTLVEEPIIVGNELRIP